MRPEDFDYICRMLRDRSGLVLNQDKGYLLESRLTPVAQRHGLAGLDALIAKLRAGGDDALSVEVTEAMTTNESFFFRDEHIFTGFRDSILPRIMEARAAHRHLRIWCAAASSGQEPYTLAMILKEAGAKLDGWKCEIIGTDISNQILKRASDGLYSQFEVQRGLPVQLLVKYFEKDDQMWRIAPEIKSMVQYRKFNLLENMSILGSFDIVFCRNVLIYFDQVAKGDILGRIAQLMPADGILVLGGAESVVGITDQFIPDPDQRGVYCKSNAGQSAPVATYTTKLATTSASLAQAMPPQSPVTAVTLTAAPASAAAPGPAAPAPVVAAPKPAAPATAALAASAPTAPVKPAAPAPTKPAAALAAPAAAKPAPTTPATTVTPLAKPPAPAGTPVHGTGPAKPSAAPADNSGPANRQPLGARN